jgi:hypothetical protein
VYNLASAAAATGVNRSTVLRAIKAGRLSAQRDEQGGWQIDPAELHRVFPPLPAAATSAPASAQRDAMADALVAELRAVIADLRADRDHWREAFERAQRALPMPMQPGATDEATEKAAETAPFSRLRRAWRWMQATG